MHVQMRDTFTCIRSAVDHDSIAIGQLQLLRHIPRDEKQFAKNCRIRVGRVRETRNNFLRHDQDMYGRLRIHIVEGNGVLVFPDYFGGNFARDNFLKNRHEPYRFISAANNQAVPGR